MSYYILLTPSPSSSSSNFSDISNENEPYPDPLCLRYLYLEQLCSQSMHSMRNFVINTPLKKRDCGNRENNAALENRRAKSLTGPALGYDLGQGLTLSETCIFHL